MQEFFRRPKHQNLELSGKLDGKRVVVQSLGNVGYHAACFSTNGCITGVERDGALIDKRFGRGKPFTRGSPTWWRRDTDGHLPSSSVCPGTGFICGPAALEGGHQPRQCRQNPSATCIIRSCEDGRSRRKTDEECCAMSTVII
jgi:hypothetical protein